MILERLTLENFRSHASLELDLGGLRCAAVVGRNGAGKSSIFDAAFWCLYGGSAGDELIRHGADRVAVTLTVAAAAHRTRVSRGRQRGRRTWLHVEWSEGDEDWRPVDLHLIADAQQFVEREVMGMDADAFRASVYTPQGEAGYLASLRPGERKALLGGLLGLDSYEEWRQAAAIEARQLELRRQLLDQLAEDRAAEARALGAPAVVAEAAEVALAKVNTELADVERRIEAGHERERIIEQVARRRQLGEQMNGLVRRKEQAQKTNTRRAELMAKLVDEDSVRDLYGLHDSARKEYERRRAEAGAEAKQRESALAQAERTGQRAERQQDAARAKIEATQRELAALQKERCPTCGQEVTPEQIGEVLEQLTKRLAAEGEALEEGKREMQEVAEELERCKAPVPEPDLNGYDPDAYERASAARDELKSVKQALEFLEEPEDTEALKAEWQRLKELREELPAEVPEGEDLVVLRGRRAELQLTQGTAQDELERARRDAETLDRLVAERQKAIDESAVVAERHEALEIVAKAFSRNGIPAMILDNAVRGIERHANEVLDELGGAMRLTLETQRMTKQNKVSETLQIIVDDGFEERPLESFSGGERYRVHVALRLGLADVLATQSGHPLDFLLIDEPTDLDAEGMAMLAELLTRLDRQVLLVTHQADLVSSLPERITVERQSEVAPSTVSIA